MAYLLDILGSAILGGIVVLLTIGINLRLSTGSSETLNSTLTQRDAVESSEILEYDLYKVGYRIPGEKIAIADSTTIKYYADVNDDGTADTVYYYMGTTAEMSSTMNPNDKPLYRVQNNEPPYISSVVTEFRLAYVDSAGNQFSYSSLNSAVQRARIRGIETTVEFESGYPIDGVYQAVELERSISPKNL
jgi:hypothetical protein